MSDKRKKIFIMVTNGPEDPEMATIPFVMATSAQASDVDKRDGGIKLSLCVLA